MSNTEDIWKEASTFTLSAIFLISVRDIQLTGTLTCYNDSRLCKKSNCQYWDVSVYKNKLEKNFKWKLQILVEKVFLLSNSSFFCTESDKAAICCRWRKQTFLLMKSNLVSHCIHLGHCRTGRRKNRMLHNSSWTKCSEYITVFSLAFVLECLP